MKFITRIIIGSGIALVGFFAVLLFAGKDLNTSLLTGVVTFVAYIILSSSIVVNFLNEGQDRAREDPHGIKDMADRLRKGKRGI